MKPANDFRPGYGIAIGAYVCGAMAIMLPAIAVPLAIGLMLVLRFKARGNAFLSSHLKPLIISSLLIMAFNLAGSIGLEQTGIIKVSADPENPASMMDEAQFEKWLPLISATFFLYLGWTIPRLVTGIKLLRKGYAVKRSRYLGAVLKAT